MTTEVLLAKSIRDYYIYMVVIYSLTTIKVQQMSFLVGLASTEKQMTRRNETRLKILPIARPICWYRAIQSERLYVNKVYQPPHPSVSYLFREITTYFLNNLRINNVTFLPLLLKSVWRGWNAQQFTKSDFKVFSTCTSALQKWAGCKDM